MTVVKQFWDDAEEKKQPQKLKRATVATELTHVEFWTLHVYLFKFTFQKFGSSGN